MLKQASSRRYAGNVTLDDVNEGNVVPVRPGTKTPVCTLIVVGSKGFGLPQPLAFNETTVIDYMCIHV